MNLLLISGLAFVAMAIFVVTWLGWQLLQQNGRILLRLDELEKRLNELESGPNDLPEGLLAGTEAPVFGLPDLDGERRSLADFPGQPLLLIFFNPDCGYCRELLPKLEDQAENRERKAEEDGGLDWPSLLIITTGDPEENRRLFARHPLNCPVLLQKEGEVAEAYQVNGTPGGYLIGPDGRIASKLAMGAQVLLALLNSKHETRNAKPETDPSLLTSAATEESDRANRFRNHSLNRSRIKRDGLKAGTPAPDFRRPRLDGQGDLALSDLRGKRVLLVFSSPGCGPCDALAPDLAKFHRQHPEVELLLVSKGEPQENRVKVREHGLAFPIVLQQQWEISRLYAMFATPVAYLIDEAGIIVEDVAVGGEAISELMKHARERTATESMASA